MDAYPEMRAYCGLQCHLCPVLDATMKNDDALRAKTAEKFLAENNWKLKPEEINCEGCKSNGRLFGYCRDCKPRKCCSEKGLDHCALCPEYPCNDLEAFFKLEPVAKKELEKLRRKAEI